MRSHAAAAALLATLLLMTGCASTPAAEEASGPPVMGYLERVKARVAAAQASPTHRIRFNPVVCDCPPYEVELEGVWQRVAFTNGDPQDPAVLLLEAAAQESQRRGTHAVWTVAGSLEDATMTCARGAIVVGFTIDVFEPEPETPPPAEPDEPATTEP
ncbi:MAG: hypothetical protein KC635_11730 [Myxococcales bacterium]|nr:hypothetical protein [Myxococcales bacterium]